MDDRDEAMAKLFAVIFLTDQLGRIKHGWRKEVRAKKKFLRRELNEGLRDLKASGVIQ